MRPSLVQLSLWNAKCMNAVFFCVHVHESGTVQGTRLFRCLTNIFINEHLWCVDEPCSMVNLYQGPLEHACLHRYYMHRATDDRIWEARRASTICRDTNNGTNLLISPNKTRIALTNTHTYPIQHIVTIQNTCVMNWMNVNIKSNKCY